MKYVDTKNFLIEIMRRNGAWRVVYWDKRRGAFDDRVQEDFRTYGEAMDYAFYWLAEANDIPVYVQED